MRKFPWTDIINNKNKIHAWKYLRHFRSCSISMLCSVTVFRKCWLVCHKNKSKTFSIRTFKELYFPRWYKVYKQKTNTKIKTKVRVSLITTCFEGKMYPWVSSFLTLTSVDPAPNYLTFWIPVWGLPLDDLLLIYISRKLKNAVGYGINVESCKTV